MYVRPRVRAISAEMWRHASWGFPYHFLPESLPSKLMSSPPNGRALVLPAVWATRAVAAAPKTVELRSPTDEELMARLQASDSKAHELLFARYSILALRIASRFVNNHREAEEVEPESSL